MICPYCLLQDASQDLGGYDYSETPANPRGDDIDWPKRVADSLYGPEGETETQREERQWKVRSIPIVRSWPEDPPEGRLSVPDFLPRFMMSEYDYRELPPKYQDTGVILIEWDMAIDPVDLTDFAARCERDPQMVRVVNYRLPGSEVHRRHSALQRCPTPFGLIYLPAWALQKWISEPLEGDQWLTDSRFAVWLMRQMRPIEGVIVDPAPVVHLH